MFARLAVLVCLLNTGAFPHTSGSAPASRGMFVLVRNQTRNPPAAMYAMRQEAAALMQTAGYRVHWLDEPREVTAAFLVIVTLDERGAAQPQSPRTVLASAAVAEGRILPFVTINCATVREFLPTALRSKLPPPFVYGRALGRLMAHELYHIAGRTGEHSKCHRRIDRTGLLVEVVELDGSSESLTAEDIERFVEGFTIEGA